MEYIFALFYLSGILKSFCIYYHMPIPVDLTLLAAVLMLISIVVHYCKEKIPLQYDKRNLIAFGFLLVFYVWLLVTLFYTPSKSYSYQKAALFIPNILAFAYPLVLKKFNIAKFFRFISLVLPIFSIVFISIYLDYINYRGANKEIFEPILGLYLVCSTLLGINVLVLACSKERIFKSSVISTSVLITSLLMMVILGARGPLIFCLVLLILYWGFSIIKTIYIGKILTSGLKKMVYGFLFLIVFFGMFLFFGEELDYLLGRSLVRFELLMPSESAGGTNMGNSVNVRVEQLNFGMELVTDNLNNSMFGYGLGSFGILHTGQDGRSYPHNIFLEIWIEAGLLGLCFFLCFLWMIFSKNINGFTYINILVLLFILLNSLKSSSFIDIRVYFAIFGMYILNSNSQNSISNNRNTILRQV
ncbi:MAG TPA: O-antigen ligase family protein [Bacteroidales bacterium]|nr:O-antigen ligase family protein [Bacteroidales bacterium]